MYVDLETTIYLQSLCPSRFYQDAPSWELRNRVIPTFRVPGPKYKNSCLTSCLICTIKTIYRLEKKTVITSKSERQSWITGLAECLRYMSIQKDDFAAEVVTAVHRTWLEAVLSAKHEGQTSVNLIKHSAACMTSLVKYWMKQSKEENGEKFDQLVRNFWQNVASTLLSQIEKAEDDSEVLERHVLLLKSLKQSFHQEAKKQLRIKFDGDAPVVDVSVFNAPTL